MMQLKIYEELNFEDDFFFGKTLRDNPKLCKKLLEVTLKKKIRKIVYLNQQQEFQETYDSHGIRMDVYVEDAANTVYDLEMQTIIKKNLGKRARYYQAVIDLNLIERGKDYNTLKKSYIIFFCMHDPFGKGRSVYTFENRCLEMPELSMGDGAKVIFLSADGNTDDISEDLRNFLHYLKNHEPKDAFTEELQDAVERARANKKWRLEYMTFGQLIMEERAEAKEEGREEGISRGAAEQIVRMGRKFGMSDKEIMEELINVCHMSEEKAREYLELYKY